MKKQLGIILMGALILSTGATLAEDDAQKIEDVRKSVRDQIELRNDIRDDRINKLQEDRTAERTAQREETKKQIEAIKKEAAEKRKGYVSTRLRQIIDVITKHQTRLETAIAAAKAKYPTLVTTEADSKLADSKKALALAKTHFDALDQLKISDTNKETVTAAREHTKKAQESLKKAQSELIAGVKALAASVREIKKAEQTTPAPTPAVTQPTTNQ